MRMVIDLQGAQTQSRFRGIGRYSLSIAQAIARNREDHEILIALNGMFPETIEPIRAAFVGLLPPENIRVWYAPGPVRESQPGNDLRRAAAERIREAFLASLEPDVILVTSLFEGFVDDAVTSIGIFDLRTPTVVALHDLIPLLNPDHYLRDNPAYKQYYLRKIYHLKRAHAWLAVSDSSARDAITALGIPPDRVFTTYEACDERFRPIDISDEQKTELFSKYSISRPFVMCAPGGTDPRKNLDRLIRAFARLPDDLRRDHQLVIVSTIDPEDKKRLEDIARDAHLEKDKLVITGYVTDEDLLKLYNLCRLFVFPSWHEGFGLPPLEAMACGAPVIASSTSSLPEVIGREDALFDPFSVESISSKMAVVLLNEDLRQDLIRHGLQQAKRFSWNECARKVIGAVESILSKNKISKRYYQLNKRPLLAYISPLPPERSGISDYSAELLPELAKYYDIEVVVNHPEVTDPWIRACLPIRSVDYFKKNAYRYDRVLYHIGNSPFHHHMFEMLDEYPGVTVLHDFYLGNFKANMEFNGIYPGAWTHSLYESHGYKAVFERFHEEDLEKTIFTYPCNFDAISKSLGIIVHSSYSSKLALKWYGAGKDWAVIPHLRVLPRNVDRIAARKKLGVPQDAFLVCSFGLIAPTKNNHRLLNAWIKSSLSRDRHCQLVFVGENHGGEYGQSLLKTIKESGVQDRVHITGWVDRETFRSYLEAADVAVQLRTRSRGETSGTILDCMSYGLPLIVNAHGSSAELPDDAVYMLPDDFRDEELVEALELLWRDAERRESLGRRAREVISANHAPSRCAKQYCEAIERFYERARTGTRALIESIAELDGMPSDDKFVAALADCIARSLPRKHPARQIFVDVSAIVQCDLRTGVERVTRGILRCLLLDPPEGYRVEPVYASPAHGYRYARSFTMRFLECPMDLQDDPIEYQAGDIFLGLDLNQYVVTAQSRYLEFLRNAGVKIFFVVYDVLPIQMPEVFPPGTDDLHSKWLSCVCRVSDGVLCISKSVADGVAEWLKSHGPDRLRPLRVEWFHIGADLESSSPTRGLPENASKVLNQIRSRMSFLMVGTIEPRKGYPQAIGAFEMLWMDGADVNLVIVGREGWTHLSDDMRRNIPETVNRLRHHPELGRRLFWLDGISDEYLERVYESCKCLVAASLGEGFGLPLIEAAQHKMPIIARDIPVFREVAGDHAFYFKGDEPSDLASAIKEWLELYREKRHPESEGMRWLTWRESTEMLLQRILEGQSRFDTRSAPEVFSGKS
ncbi:glycosyltransferase [Methanothrix thermoacetophila]|uniref:Glycosyl transferase, group 1 n=1 Tax=Methanothrix thermoacetophila (strain DSM 6194 / JCM 14653 / NBRC 101360 / PT) TaxID=349307 RepID=A0B833_METTP|nr:glycosyltransferase [Methanothrix thermoacetophila]ABK14857.1 glycosyl transferase, group 1 [Methanothrix thermoacetophila PT]